MWQIWHSIDSNADHDDDIRPLCDTTVKQMAHTRAEDENGDADP